MSSHVIISYAHDLTLVDETLPGSFCPRRISFYCLLRNVALGFLFFSPTRCRIACPFANSSFPRSSCWDPGYHEQRLIWELFCSDTVERDGYCWLGRGQIICHQGCLSFLHRQWQEMLMLFEPKNFGNYKFCSWMSNRMEAKTNRSSWKRFCCPRSVPRALARNRSLLSGCCTGRGFRVVSGHRPRVLCFSSLLLVSR